MKCVIVHIFILISFEIPCLNMVNTDSIEASLDLSQPDDILRRHNDEHLRQKRWLQELYKIEDLDSRELANNEISEVKGPVTPVMNYHKRRQFAKVSTTTASGDGKEKKENDKKTTDKKENEKKAIEKKDFKIKPIITMNEDTSTTAEPNSFSYRRGLDPNFNAPVQGVHCMELISPHFLGETSLGMFKIIKSTDHVVYSLIDLLAEHTDSKSEIYSILYQISTMKIRLYQWDDKAMRILVNQITKDRLQSFRTLKMGIKQLFANWHLDITNITNLLLQTKIFRPPCIQTSEFSGSTKGTSPVEFRKPPTTRKVCPSNEDEDGDC